MKTTLLLLSLTTSGLYADEARFDPPLKGAYLGVELEKTGRGLRVVAVKKLSSAEVAGIQAGDLLLAFGDFEELPRWSVRQLWEALGKLPGKGAYQVTVLRDGRKLQLKITPDPAMVRDARTLARRFRNHYLFRGLEKKRGLLAGLEADLIAAVRTSPSTQSAYEALNEIIDRFDVSHTAVIPPWSYASMLGKGADGKAVFHLGLTAQKIVDGATERFFIRELMYGSSAREAGLKIGDEVRSVNSIPFSRSPRRTLAGYEARHAMYTIQVDTEEMVRIEIRRVQGEAVRNYDVRADRASTALDSTTRSIRMLGPEAPGLGYIHLWNLLSRETVTIFEKALREELGAARGLVIDLRGRGGQVPVLKAIAQRVEADGRPAALLVDDLTRSAKEVLAYMLKGKKGVSLIGDTTAGAVRAAGYVQLENGARAMIPVNARIQIEKLTGGEDLEGRGVDPDIFVEFRLPFLGGRDPLLDRATALLSTPRGAARGAARRRRL